ncbi:MAG: YqaJ viral recombinase family protein [Sulfitobacter sp.]|nr:YqaJ viral recombinase family protein [Sulfitobacter sp.]
MPADPLATERARQEKRLREFVARYEGGTKQRSAEWLTLKKTTVGGSEIGILLGFSGYSTRNDLLTRKVGGSKFTANAACAWGTMFEPLAERFVEVDLSTTVLGSDMFIGDQTVVPHHTNSPDGYCVVSLADLGGPKWPATMLLEFKSPYSRLPAKKMPKMYVPQVWSGVALSPVTHGGLFVDAFFRVCQLHQLGTGPEVSSFHKPFDWGEARAWGAIRVFAPRMGRRGKLQLDSEVDMWAAGLLQAHLGVAANNKTCGREVLDFGELSAEDGDAFKELLIYIDRKELKTEYGEVHVPGAASAGAEIDAALLREMRHGADYYLLGFIPWKLMRAEYTVIPKNKEFAETATPLVRRFIEDCDALKQTANPQAALADLRRDKALEDSYFG